MLRHALARVLHAVADRIEPDAPTVEIQYVYVYSAPPVIPQPYRPPYWQGPWTTQAASTDDNTSMN